MSAENTRIVPLNFDSLQLHKEEVNIEGKIHILTEADADAGARYKDGMAKKIKMTNGKPTGIEGYADLDILLVSDCLTLDGAKIPVSTIGKWPNKVVKAIADRAKHLSGLDEMTKEEKEEAKNG